MQLSTLFRKWWVILLQGILMIVLSILIFNNPDSVLSAIAFYLGAIVIVSGIIGIIAWFTNEIQGSFGPEMYQGQLPGAILEMDINNGKSTFKALEVLSKIDVAKIKEPSKGKKVTPEEFVKEREKLMNDMQMNGGGNINIRHN